SAPLDTSKTGVVGLNGAFEIESFVLYRDLDDLLHVVRNEALPRPLPVDPGARAQQPAAIPAAERALVEKFIRQWHIVTISGAAWFALMSLADFDARAGHAASARTRRAEAAALKAFDHPYFADLQPAAVYRAGLFYEQPYRMAALRTLAR